MRHVIFSLNEYVMLCYVTCIYDDAMRCDAMMQDGLDQLPSAIARRLSERRHSGLNSWDPRQHVSFAVFHSLLSINQSINQSRL